MTENVDNLIIEHLKGMRNELREFRSKHGKDMTDIKHRLITLERGMASIKHENAGFFEDQVTQQSNMDEMNERIEKIERRLELVNA